MDRDSTTFDRSTSDMASKSCLEDQTAPLTPNGAENPEFARWWKRWASRVRRISVRKKPSARRVKIDPPNSNLGPARLISAECEFKRYL